VKVQHANQMKELEGRQDTWLLLCNTSYGSFYLSVSLHVLSCPTQGEHLQARYSLTEEEENGAQGESEGGGIISHHF
jgi:hypothetical protein